MESIWLAARHLAGSREEREQELSKVIGPYAVEIVFPLTSRFDQARHPEQGEMVADRWLALPETLAQVGDVELAVGGESQVKQNAQACFVAQ